MDPITCIACGYDEVETYDVGAYLGIPSPVCCGVQIESAAPYPDVHVGLELDFLGEWFE